jgi:hypothetical protein
MKVVKSASDQGLAPSATLSSAANNARLPAVAEDKNTGDANGTSGI